jgi:hypothetical protein
MDIRDLANIDTANPEAVKSVQNWLRAQGVYRGPIDGKWGKDTLDAVTAVRNDDATRRAQDAALQQQAQALEAQRLKTQETQAANDPTNRLTKMATEATPYGAGLGVGAIKAVLGAKSFGRQDAAISDAANRLADARNITPGAAESGMNRLLKGRNVSKASAFIPPALAFGAGAVTRDVIAPGFSDPGTRDIINSIGTGENAAGLGMTVGAATNLLRPDPVDAVTRARILSRGTPIEDAVPSPPPALPAPDVPASTGAGIPYQKIRHSDRAKAAYKAAGGEGNVTKEQAIDWLETPGNVTKVNRAAVVQELGDGAGKNLPNTLRILRGTGKYVIPALIAGAAADASYSDAKARGLSDMDAGRNAAMDATATGVGTGAGLYTANKLLPKIMDSPVGKIAGRLALPAAVAYDAYQEATQPNPEDRPFTRRISAMATPTSVQGGPIVSGVNAGMSDMGMGTIDDHLANFINYMQQQGTR